MEPTTEFEFNVDEQYENEKGVFTVVSIHKDEMVIRWESGEEIGTDIGFQRRIQERREREKFTKETATKGHPRRAAALRVRPAFDGLQPSDFKNNAARTNWCGDHKTADKYFRLQFLGLCPKARNALGRRRTS